MFFITGLPRSRTAWMAAFLSDGIYCAHELMNGCKSREEFYERMESVDGNSDCGLPFSDFQTRWDAPTVVIERNPAEVSLALKQDVSWLVERLRTVEGLRVPFRSLDERMEEICEHIGVPYDPWRHELFASMNIQVKEIWGDPDSLRIWLWRG